MKIFSTVAEVGTIEIPLYDGELSMIPFQLNTLKGLPDFLIGTAEAMLVNLKQRSGEAFFTIHGKQLKKEETLRRGGPHVDGNYDREIFDWVNDWKVGKSGPGTSTEDHKRLYISEKGGIIIASNFESCLGWTGLFDGVPGVGGDCSHINLNTPFMLKQNRIYYGNNHFIHESIPMAGDFHRVMVRITLPMDHVFEG